MSADKMPPLPATDWVLHMPARQHEPEWTSYQDGYSDADMHSYATDYAAEQTRELVALLCECREHFDCCTKYDGANTNNLDTRCMDAIAKHKEQA